MILMQISHLWMVATGNEFADVNADPIVQLAEIEAILQHALDVELQ